MYLPCNQWYCLTKLLVLFGNYTCQKTTVTALKYGQGEKSTLNQDLYPQYVRQLVVTL